MANITRYTPATGMVPLREAMNRLFQDAFAWPTLGGDASLTGGMGIPSNLFEQGDRYIIQVALPGVSAEKLEITVQQNVLEIKGAYAGAVPEGARSIWASLPAGEFSYSFTLPSVSDAQQATADYHDGMLTVSVPKAEQARAHAIKIGAASSAT